MKLAIIGAGKWGLTIMERILSKAQYSKLPLWQLTTRYLVPRLHCNLVACQQLAHMTSHIRKVQK